MFNRKFGNKNIGKFYFDNIKKYKEIIFKNQIIFFSHNIFSEKVQRLIVCH